MHTLCVLPVITNDEGGYLWQYFLTKPPFLMMTEL